VHTLGIGLSPVKAKRTASKLQVPDEVVLDGPPVAKRSRTSPADFIELDDEFEEDEVFIKRKAATAASKQTSLIEDDEYEDGLVAVKRKPAVASRSSSSSGSMTAGKMQRGSSGLLERKTSFQKQTSVSPPHMYSRTEDDFFSLSSSLFPAPAPFLH